MFERTITEADLSRLKREREVIDLAYNDALSALDRILEAGAEPGDPPPEFDETQITPLNEQWRLIAPEGPTFETGWKGRLGRFIWRTIAPFLERQEAFNAALVDHVNRNVSGHREMRRASRSSLETLRHNRSAFTAFQQHLIVYLQQITPYVDSKDREETGLLRRATEDTSFLLEVYKERIDQAVDELRDRASAVDVRVNGFAAALSGVSDEVLKRWESMVARERRYEARVASLAAAHEELRTALGVLQHASTTLKRELERVSVAPPAATGAAPDDTLPISTRSDTLGGYAYVAFEDLFRGSQDDIRTRVSEYLPIFERTQDVLDVGCGRGEFLDLLRAQGVTARGLDLNHEMVEVCRARGLDAVHGDALAYLESLPDDSLGGLFAAQVVEHLQPDYLVRLLETASQKLREGAPIVLETINPACWFAFFESYVRDITHVQPLHPDTLKYLLTATGFQHVTVRYRAPYPEREKLQVVPLAHDHAGGQDALTDVIETVNTNVEKLNRLLFTFLDYAVIARRP